MPAVNAKAAANIHRVLAMAVLEFYRSWQDKAFNRRGRREKPEIAEKFNTSNALVRALSIFSASSGFSLWPLRLKTFNFTDTDQNKSGLFLTQAASVDYR